MFLGCYDHVLDEKGRTSLPKDFRAPLSQYDQAPYLTALPRCLGIYAPEEFESLQAQLADASRTIDSVQGLQRLIVGMATRCPFDKQGRILIPPKLREWAHLERDLVFTGVGRRIEIWDRSLHKADLERTRDEYPGYGATFKEFGL